MNKILCNFFAAFIANKEKRDSFRRKNIRKKINIEEIYYQTTNITGKFSKIVDEVILNKLIENNRQLNKVYYREKFLCYKNVEKILSLKDKYKGQKCFIIGGSPSLKQLDLTKLNGGDYKIFTVGRGYKLKDFGLLHSDFRVVSDMTGYSEILDELDEDYSDIFFSYCGIDFANNVKELIYFDYFEAPINMDKHYQSDLTRPLFHCDTVIDFALQIATYMGFKDIYFVGVDLDFNKNSGHVYKSSAGENERQISHSKNSNLFMLSSFEFAAKYLKDKGINLYNASPSGILNCMPRVNYNDLFNNN